MKRERLDLLKFVMTWGAPPATAGAGAGGGAGVGVGGADGVEGVSSRPGCCPEDWRAVRGKLPRSLMMKPLYQIARVYQVGRGMDGRVDAWMVGRE